MDNTSFLQKLFIFEYNNYLLSVYCMCQFICISHTSPKSTSVCMILAGFGMDRGKTIIAGSLLLLSL